MGGERDENDGRAGKLTETQVEAPGALLAREPQREAGD
jgi:hypothetical protein